MQMQCCHHMHIKLKKEKESTGGADHASLLSEKKLLHCYYLSLEVEKMPR